MGWNSWSIGLLWFVFATFPALSAAATCVHFQCFPPSALATVKAQAPATDGTARLE